MKRSRPAAARLLAAAAMLCSTASTSADSIVSRFDAGLEGWSPGPSTGLSHAPDGGNPGGYAEVVDAGVPDMAVLAPPAFLGDLRDFDGGTFSFDALYIPLEGGGPLCLGTYGIVTITGPAGIAASDLVPECPTEECWRRFSAPLDAEVWHVAPQIWQAILADVTSISIRVEAVTLDEAGGLDNIALMPPGQSNADLTGDGVIGFQDLLVLLSAWGPCGTCCNADLNGDGVVDFDDLLELLAAWGPLL